MPKDRIHWVSSHLDRCEDCRLEYHRLQASLDHRLEIVPDGGLLAQMRAAMQQWERTPWASSQNGDLIKRRVADRIAPYLGAAATQSILQPVSETGENLLSTVEPVLALFLGNRAASRLVSHVVDMALLKA